MRAFAIRIALMVVVARAVLASQPAADPTARRESAPGASSPSSASGATSPSSTSGVAASEPVTMVVSGAALLSVAGALRRYLP